MQAPVNLELAGPILLRAALPPFSTHDQEWPDVEDPAACRAWLRQVTGGAWFGAVREASPRLADAVHRVLLGDSSGRQVTRTTAGVARYLLRAAGRPTPFGLFSGVASACVGGTSVKFGADHRVRARPDTLWFDDVRRQLLSRPDVIRQVSFQVSDLNVRHGGVVVAHGPGGSLSRTRVRRPLAVLLDAAAAPATFREIADRFADVGADEDRVIALLVDAVAARIVTSSLCAPQTDEDPLGHLLNQLLPCQVDLPPDVASTLLVLQQIHQAFGEHNRTANPREAAAVRAATAATMTTLSDKGRTRRLSRDSWKLRWRSPT